MEPKIRLPDLIPWKVHTRNPTDGTGRTESTGLMPRRAARRAPAEPQPYSTRPGLPYLHSLRPASTRIKRASCRWPCALPNVIARGERQRRGAASASCGSLTAGSVACGAAVLSPRPCPAPRESAAQTARRAVGHDAWLTFLFRRASSHRHLPPQLVEEVEQHGGMDGALLLAGCLALRKDDEALARPAPGPRAGRARSEGSRCRTRGAAYRPRQYRPTQYGWPP